MKQWMNKVQAFIRDDAGASAVEYALLVGGIAVAVAGTIYVLGNAINNMFNNIANKLG